MSVKTPNHENIVQVWHPSHFTQLMFYLFFFNLAAILEICKLASEDVICQLANIFFFILHTKIPLIVTSKPFLHKMPVPS